MTRTGGRERRKERAWGNERQCKIIWLSHAHGLDTAQVVDIYFIQRYTKQHGMTHRGNESASSCVKWELPRLSCNQSDATKGQSTENP